MTTGTLHTTWLSLIDRSGPFLSVQVLESALPQGLEAVQTKFKQKLRLAYEEWRDAVDNEDPLLTELHKEWIKLVLWDILEYDNTSLILNSLGEIKYTNEELASDYAPTFIVKSPVSNRVRFFIDILPPEMDADKLIEGDKWPASTVEKMKLLCRSQNVRYGLVTNGEKWTIVSTPIGATSGTATWYSRLWRYEPVTLKAFQTLLGVRRCFGSESETLDRLLDSSLNSYEEVTNTLGEQVRRAVEVLIQSLDSADQDRNRELLEGIPPSELYDASVTVMMRLVFILCAEERGLLLLGDPIFDQFYAISTLRAQLAEEAGKIGPEVLERRHDAWSRLLAMFRSIYGGIDHEALRLPPLGGSLFNPDKYPFLEGRKTGSSWRDSGAVPLPIDNRTVLLLLTALQVLEQKGGALHLSYRALDVEQIGHVYEGLLDSTVSRMPTETLVLKGSKQFKSTLLSLLELETEWKKGLGPLTSYLEEKLERKSAALLRTLNAPVSDHEYGTLILACGGDEALATRIKPFFHLLQTDIWGHPLVYKTGSYAVTLGLDRRESGTHYTPKSLTETIVSLALEPLIYYGSSETSDKSKWKLKRPNEILSLKICDPAMGSAAFLVQACRFLSEHLVVAWGNETAEDQKNLPKDLHERLLLAKRRITECCLYGVDINPLAVELAKLSLWLITMSKGKPFEFLDHNFKSGDSIVGLHSISQLKNIRLDESNQDSQGNLFDQEVIQSVEKCIKARLSIRDVRVNDIRDIQRMSSLNNEASLDIKRIKFIADAMCGYALSSSGNKSNLETSLQMLKSSLPNFFSGNEETVSSLASRTKDNLTVEINGQKILKRPFHWPIEFPEVFITSNGFDALVGNPPFIGGRRMRGAIGSKVLDWLTLSWPHSSMNADYCSFFYLQSSRLLNPNGYFGFLATKTIGQGDTARTGLAHLIDVKKFTIFTARSSFIWPGTASVVAAMVIATSNVWNRPKILDDKEVSFISPVLDDKAGWGEAKVIHANVSKSFQGSVLVGMGFVLTEEEARNYITQRNENSEVVKPFLSGDNLNTNVSQSASRWAIDFRDRSLEECEQKWPEVLERIRLLVKPEREKVNREAHRKYWWHYGDKRPALYNSLNGKLETFVTAAVSKYVSIIKVPVHQVFMNKVYVFDLSSWSNFCLLQCSFHDVWVRRGSSTQGETLNYTPSDYFDTYPFLHIQNDDLERLGESYHETRKQIMASRQIGLTDFYNLVHAPNEISPDIVSFREAIKNLDQAVANAYGWTNVELGHGFHQTKQGIRYTISENATRFVLECLLKLNQQIASSEENQPKKAKLKSKKSKDRQETDLGENE